MTAELGLALLALLSSVGLFVRQWLKTRDKEGELSRTVAQLVDQRLRTEALERDRRARLNRERQGQMRVLQELRQEDGRTYSAIHQAPLTGVAADAELAAMRQERETLDNAFGDGSMDPELPKAPISNPKEPKR